MVLSARPRARAEASAVARVLAAAAHRPGAEVLGELGELREGLAEVGWRWGPELDELALAVEAAGLDPTAVRGLAAELRRGAG
jgi:hypothetical protein